jgi:hypothetical protein
MLMKDTPTRSSTVNGEDVAGKTTYPAQSGPVWERVRGERLREDAVPQDVNVSEGSVVSGLLGFESLEGDEDASNLA